MSGAFRTAMFPMTNLMVMLTVAPMPRMALGGTAAESFRWSVALSKEKVFPGEPVLLILTVRNTGGEKMEIDLGMHGIGAFSVEIQDASNDSVARSLPYHEVDGIDMGYKRAVALAPGESHRRELVLNRFCSTRLPVGSYRMHVFVDPAAVIVGDTATSGSTAGPRVVLTCNLEVIQTNVEEFERMLSDLAAKALADYGHRLEKEMLSFTDSSMAVEYQIRLVKRYGHLYSLATNTIQNFHRSRSKESLQALLEIASDKSISDRYRKKALGAIEDLRTRGDPGVVQMIDELCTK